MKAWSICKEDSNWQFKFFLNGQNKTFHWTARAVIFQLMAMAKLGDVSAFVTIHNRGTTMGTCVL